MGEEKTLKRFFNKAVNFVTDLITEEEVEIIDNGLDDVEDSFVDKEESAKKKEYVKSETAKSVKKDTHYAEDVNDDEVVESYKPKKKNPFSKSTTKTLEEDLFKPEEVKTTMELIKENPVLSVEVIEEKKPVKKVDFKYEKAPSVVENETEELTAEQKEAEEFHAKLDDGEMAIKTIRKNVIFKEIETQIFRDGFENTFFDLLEAIDESTVLEKDEKILKKNTILSELMSIDSSREDEVFDYFIKIRNELHKVENSLGEYNEKVYTKNGLRYDYILSYDIARMYENMSEDKEIKEYILESDLDNFLELLSLYNNICDKLESNNYISAQKRNELIDEYVNLVVSSNDMCRILKNIQLFKYDLYKIENGLDEFSKMALAFS